MKKSTFYTLVVIALFIIVFYLLMHSVGLDIVWFWIVLATVPVAFILIVLVALVFWFLDRHQKKKEGIEDESGDRRRL